ncbi:MAG TPA: TonB-dependent siderophore receptor [Verrucomicrobiae bacterium]
MNDKSKFTALLIAQGLAATAHAQSTNLPPVTLPSKGTNAPVSTTGTNAPTKLPEVIVTGQRESYKTDKIALPKFTEPLRDTAQSITVVPREVMDDQNTTTLRDALRNVAGISIAAGEGGSQGDSLTLRGFTARNDIFLDGMRDYGSYYRDPFNYESVDVLEGPESVMFGRGSTGGIINQQSKTPELDSFVAGTLSFGTDLTRRGTVDVNEQVPGIGWGQDATAVRLNLMGNINDVADRNVTENQRYGIAPSITFGLGTPTELNLSYLHISEDDIPDYGVPWYKYTGQTGTTGPANVSRDNYYGFKDDYLKTDADIITVALDHTESENLTFHNQARFANYTRDFRITEPQLNTGTNVITAATPLSAINVSRNELGGFSTETFLWDQFDVTTKFKTAFIEHTLVTGVEGGQETSDPTRFGYNNALNQNTVPSTSLLAPDENAYYSGLQTVKSQVTTTANSAGLYALDTMKLDDHWELSGGARWDYFSADYHSAALPGALPTPVTASAYEQTITKPSWRAAVVYKPVEIGSIYFDYGTSWNPSAESLSLSSSTQNLPPEENETFEFGSKWDLIHERLSVRGSIFRTDKTNARETDPNNSLNTVLAGKERVDGVELAVSGHLTKRWQVFASYDYLMSDMVSSDFYLTGGPLSNVPKNTFSFWTTYELPWKFEVGAGVDYVSSRTANSSTLNNATVALMKGQTVEEMVAGYYSVKAMIQYKVTKNITCQVNINNLTDNHFYDQIHPAHVIPGSGISALFSTSFKF